MAGTMQRHECLPLGEESPALEKKKSKKKVNEATVKGRL
jgi:hypothetical protein